MMMYDVAYHYRSTVAADQMEKLKVERKLTKGSKVYHGYA